VIERNAAGITVEFPVSELAGYKVGIPGEGIGAAVGDTVPVEGELLSMVDTRSASAPGLGSVAAHVKVAGYDFYVDPDQAQLEPREEPSAAAETTAPAEPDVEYIVTAAMLFGADGANEALGGPGTRYEAARREDGAILIRAWWPPAA